MKEEQKKQGLNLENNEAYGDSNFFILAFASLDEEGDKARLILESIKKGELKLYTSPLTVDEVMWVIQYEKNRETASNCAKMMLSTPNLEFIGTTQQIISDSIEIYNKEKLNPRDAIHLASMRSKKIKSIFTTDSDFDKIKDIIRIDFSNLILAKE